MGTCLGTCPRQVRWLSRRGFSGLGVWSRGVAVRIDFEFASVFCPDAARIRSHKGHAVRQAIRAAGARLLFLPPYSPDLNPMNRSLPSSSCSCANPLRGPYPQYTPSVGGIEIAVLHIPPQSYPQRLAAGCERG